MTEFLNKSFSVYSGTGQYYRDNWDRIFEKKEAPCSSDARPPYAVGDVVAIPGRVVERLKGDIRVQFTACGSDAFHMWFTPAQVERRASGDAWTEPDPKALVLCKHEPVGFPMCDPCRVYWLGWSRARAEQRRERNQSCADVAAAEVSLRSSGSDAPVGSFTMQKDRGETPGPKASEAAPADAPRSGDVPNEVEEARNEAAACRRAYLHEKKRAADAIQWLKTYEPGPASRLEAQEYKGAADVHREPVVWADDASPFTGPQVLALLQENEKLRREGAQTKEKPAQCTTPSGRTDCHGFYQSGPGICDFCGEPVDPISG